VGPVAIRRRPLSWSSHVVTHHRQSDGQPEHHLIASHTIDPDRN